jgi:beta-lactamase regulating signal transducer with metallopeptidase domain
MSIGASLFLIATGAILRYAITWNPKDVNIDTVGLILMIVGIVGLLLSLLWMFIYADRRRERTAPPPPAPRDRDGY